MMIRTRVLLIATFASLLGAIACPAWAETRNEIQKLVASDGAADDVFGGRIAVDGDTALIPSQRNDDDGENSGSVYVFTRNGSGVWTEQQKLTASDAAAGDTFGESVALDGDTAVIGSATNDDNGEDSGSAYVFIRGAGDVWTEQQILTASDGEAGDFFAEALTVDGDTIAIGGFTNAAYIFTREAGGVWTEQQKLTAADTVGGDLFGISPSVDGDTAVFGAPGDKNGTGAAYIFRRDASGVWTEQQKLTASDGAGKDRIGEGVVVDGDTVMISALGDDDNGVNSGAVHVFTRNPNGVWNEQQKLTAGDGAALDNFGIGPALNGNTAVIGAWHDDDNGDSSGSAYVFTRDAGGVWTEQAKLIASDGEVGDSFGSVDIDGDTILIGARLDDDNGEDSGSVYVFSVKKVLGADTIPAVISVILELILNDEA